MQNNSYSPFFEGLEKKTGYSFHDKSLLILSLTHPSWSGEMKLSRTESNQRLEFLGDAVLECVVSAHLYQIHRDLEEGELTRMRASLVCESALSVCAEAIDLGTYLILGKGENSSGGRKKPSVLSDAFEAMIGAIYLDGGFEQARVFIQRYVLGTVEEFSMFSDAKSRIQEIVQQNAGATLCYRTSEREDPEGLFNSVLLINDEEVAEGSGHTKKAAEQSAALKALNRFI